MSVDSGRPIDIDFLKLCQNASLDFSSAHVRVVKTGGKTEGVIMNIACKESFETFTRRSCKLTRPGCYAGR